ncbi:hypothetical protein BD311DRAFT_187879 [Dichomitus squalens]|uniref:Uncharacterized protein n=1 Tax=Dichomitus squalens TaxID=114155 RepID=A0A4Q9Q1G1_9APHY|nr:hypothetical protein BD311DRAFT_187879 [Dichomitus squalens]TBU60909.1 hypothetical protein BD310DRAFT_251324 [Dichomitus squalens]
MCADVAYGSRMHGAEGSRRLARSPVNRRTNTRSPCGPTVTPPAPSTDGRASPPTRPAGRGAHAVLGTGFKLIPHASAVPGAGGMPERARTHPWRDAVCIRQRMCAVGRPAGDDIVCRCQCANVLLATKEARTLEDCRTGERRSWGFLCLSA